MYYYIISYAMLSLYSFSFQDYGQEIVKITTRQNRPPLLYQTTITITTTVRLIVVRPRPRIVLMRQRFLI